jgi:hypothetical protein
MFLPEPAKPYALQFSRVADYAGADNPALILTEKALAGVTGQQIAAVQEKYKQELAEFKAGPLKFLDVPYWTFRQARLARTLGLEAAAPLSVLDLGTGGGHFPCVCHHLGHSTVATDIEVPIYDDIARVLDVRRTFSPVHADQPLPDYGRKFDLVTAIAINFHRIDIAARIYWSVEQWRFLFNDLIQNHLRFPGRIYFELNREYRGDTLIYNPELLAWCAANGAIATDRGAITWQLSEPRIIS